MPPSRVLPAALLLIAAETSRASVSTTLVPEGDGCKAAMVQNQTNHALSVSFEYVYEGQSPSGTPSSYQWRWDSMGAFSPHGSGKASLFSGSVDCRKPYTVRIFNVRWTDHTVLDAQEKQYDKEHALGLGAMIDKWNNDERQRKKERLEQMRIETARRVEEQVRKDREAEARRAACPLGCDPSIKQIPPATVNYSTDDAHQRALNRLRAQQAEEKRQLELDIKRQQAEQAKAQAKAQAERDALRRHAEWHDQYVADMQARNRAAAAAQQQAERERQRLLAEQRAAEEQRRQERWQQQVNMTGSLFQGAIQGSEKALAASRNKLGQTTNTYSEESDVLNAILEQAKTAAGRK